MHSQMNIKIDTIVHAAPYYFLQEALRQRTDCFLKDLLVLVLRWPINLARPDWSERRLLLLVQHFAPLPSTQLHEAEHWGHILRQRGTGSWKSVMSAGQTSAKDGMMSAHWSVSLQFWRFYCKLNFKMSLKASFSKLIGFSFNKVFPSPQITQRQL